MASDLVIIVPLGLRSPEGDPPPAVPTAQFVLGDTSYSATQPGSIVFTIDRLDNTTQELSVDWTIQDISVTQSTGTVIFNPDDIQKTITVPTQSIGADQQGTLTLSNPTYVSGDFSQPVIGSPGVASISFFEGAVIVVRADGAGDFTTINAALTAVQPGQTIEVQADTAGTTQYWQELLTFPVGKEGSDQDNPTVLRGREGDDIILWGTGIIMRMDFNRFWFIDNFQLGRDETLNGWPYAEVQAGDWDTAYVIGRTQVEHTRCAYLTNCDYVRFDRIRAYGSRFFDSFHIESNCTYCGVCYSSLSHTGLNGKTNFGNDITCEGANCVFIGNYGWLGGHDTIHLESPNCVIMYNAFDGRFDHHYPGATWPGNRPQATEGSKGAAPWGPNLSDSNIFFGADAAGDEATSPANKTIAWNMIQRGCAFYDNHAQCCNTLPLRSSMEAGDGIRSYNNVSFNSAAVWYSSNITTQEDGVNVDTSDGFYKDWRIFNNVWADLEDPATLIWNAGFHVNILRQYTSTTDFNISTGGYPTPWRGGKFYNNYFGIENAAAGFKARIRWRNSSDSVSGTVVTNLADMETAYPNNWYNNIENGALTFVNTDARNVNWDALWRADKYSLPTHIQTIINGLKTSGSTDGTAAPHATVTSATGSGTTVVVDDARMFFHPQSDPWNFGRMFPELLPDYVKIGTGDPVQLAGINYDTNTLTLASSRSWTNGDDVFYAGRDGTAWTDIGVN
jgi:hypothetical protein